MNYRTAVLLLGAAHRKSITEKIQHWIGKEAPLLKWGFYGS
ncbi:hypothetical protein ACFSJU_07510 [Paradesertivirga mongoliensis]|uniref:Uncharacterized protein n=1 Tax=Paradesertivirga mongoliensis TaxID=2100740 RepID=A0ABW4ZKH2_9SPHI